MRGAAEILRAAEAREPVSEKRGSELEIDEAGAGDGNLDERSVELSGIFQRLDERSRQRARVRLRALGFGEHAVRLVIAETRVRRPPDASPAKNAPKIQGAFPRRAAAPRPVPLRDRTKFP